MAHFIDGTWIEGKGLPFSTISPIDGSLLYEGKEAESPLIKKAVLSAKTAFEAWSHAPFNERIECLLSFKEVLTKEKESFSLTISQETGKPLWESHQEVLSMIEKITISQRAYRERCHPEEIRQGNSLVKTRFLPHGVLAVLGPFNFPGHLPNGHIIPSLMAGNTVVYKPSEKTPLTGEYYAELMEKADFPPGVFNLLQGGKNVGEGLASLNELDGLLFTGSFAVGKKLAHLFADHPEKILALEMGGNNPLIIHDAKDLTFACFIAIQSAFLSTGQRCSCARRLILLKGPFARKFLSFFIEKVKELKIGTPFDVPEPYMGPLITLDAAYNLLKAQEKLIHLGGKPLLLAKKLTSTGAFVTPGIIDMTEVAKIPDEEVFGPLLQVIVVKDFQEALAQANKTRFGLTASLVSENRHLFELFQKKIRAGIVNWNSPSTGASSKSAFGGFKESGNHRASAFFAADYTASPVASMEIKTPKMPETLPPGMVL